MKRQKSKRPRRSTEMMHSHSKQEAKLKLLLTLSLFSAKVLATDKPIMTDELPIKGKTILHTNPNMKTTELGKPETTSRIQVPSDSHVEFAGHTIGDNHRSSKSSQSFFASVDLDGDGQIYRPELSLFLQEMIGGSAFDEEEEINEEVDSVFDKMDKSGDGSVELGEFNRFWEKLEELLTVDEVAEFIVHAGQLPKEVGQIFRTNHVTGYDFPELVENNGIALKEELGIERSTYRKKIVRAVRSRLFGIGTVPSQIENVEATIESCTTISLRWSKPIANDLPVHKYRVLRRKIGGEEKKDENIIKTNTSIDDNQMCELDIAERDLVHLYDDGEALVKTSTDLVATQNVQSCQIGDVTFDSKTQSHNNPEWKTVYDGSELEFVDGGLKPGKGYIYKIQAWNLVGKSPWKVFDPSKDWVDFGCHLQQKEKEATEQTQQTREESSSEKETTDEKTRKSSVSWVSFVFSISIGLIRFICSASVPFGAFVTFLMRLRRNSISSTADRLEPLFPWVCRHVNDFSSRYIRIHIIPESFYISRYHQTLNYHESAANMIGVNGYKSAVKINAPAKRAISDRAQTNNPSSRPGGLRRMLSEPYIHSKENIVLDKKTRPSAFKRGISFKKKTEILATSDKRSENDIATKNSRDLSPENDLSNGKAEELYTLRQKFTGEIRKLSPLTIVPVQEEEVVETASSDQHIDNEAEIHEHLNESDRTAESTKDLENPKEKKTRRGPFRRLRSPRQKKDKTVKNGKKETHPADQDEFGVSPLVIPRSAQKIPENLTLTCSNIGSFEGQSEIAIHHNRNICNTCLKKYKFPYRFRHDCCKCGSSFCNKHGKTTHPNAVPCKVPGTCICAKCLE